MYADILNYIKSLQETNPILSIVFGSLCYLLFPEQSFFTAACAVMILSVVDVATKYYAIASNDGGFINALKEKQINSESMWRGTSRKLITYLVLFLMAGLSFRITPIAAVSNVISTIVYSMLFFRECQSILENLRDAGSDVGWLLSIVSKKQKKILEDEGVKEDDEL
ncbi:MAG: phage holin family protein [Sedimentibacter sp.]